MNIIRNIYNYLVGDRLVSRAFDRFMNRSHYTNCKAHRYLLDWEHEAFTSDPTSCRY